MAASPSQVLPGLAQSLRHSYSEPDITWHRSASCPCITDELFFHTRKTQGLVTSQMPDRTMVGHPVHFSAVFTGFWIMKTLCSAQGMAP